MRRLSWLALFAALACLCTMPASATPITLGVNFTSTPNSELSAWPSGANTAVFGSMRLHVTLFPDLNAGGAPFACMKTTTILANDALSVIAHAFQRRGMTCPKDGVGGRLALLLASFSERCGL